MTGTDGATMIQVAAKLTSAEAPALKTQIADRRGRAVALDFAHVGHLGAQCLQVLLSARRAWANDELSFEVRNLRPEVRDTLMAMGLGAREIGARESAE